MDASPARDSVICSPPEASLPAVSPTFARTHARTYRHSLPPVHIDKRQSATHSLISNLDNPNPVHSLGAKDFTKRENQPKSDRRLAHPSTLPSSKPPNHTSTDRRPREQRQRKEKEKEKNAANPPIIQPQPPRPTHPQTSLPTLHNLLLRPKTRTIIISTSIISISIISISISIR